MSYYTGSVNSFDDLRTAVLSACSASGWTLADGILSKGAAFVRLYVSTTQTTTEGPGLILEGGTGKSGGSLTGTSSARPRMGRAGVSSQFSDVSWPATYHFFIFDNPDEVYIVLNFNISCFYHLAFGVSDVPGILGTGLWISGTCRRGYASSTSVSNGFYATPTSGGVSHSSTVACISGGLFWDTNGITGAGINAVNSVHTGLDGGNWSGSSYDTSPGAISACHPTQPLLDRTPSAWNSDAPLIPIQVLLWRASNKCSLIVQPRNARYVRVDNHIDGSIIELGPDRWKVFPFYAKNSASRSNAVQANHTGTFGWAIKYDGP